MTTSMSRVRRPLGRPVRAVCLAVSLATAVAMSGCASSGGGSDSGSNASVKTAKVGVVTTLTGAVASLGVPFANGAKLAVKQLNGKPITIGGTEYKLDLSVCDDQSAADQAVTCARKLAGEGNPVIIALSSFEAIPMLAFNQQAKFIIMANAGASSFIDGKNKLAVRMVALANVTKNEAKSMADQFSSEGTPVKKIVVMAVNTDLGKAWASGLTSSWPSTGGSVATVPFEQAITDFSSQVGAALHENPDAIALTSTCDIDANIINEAQAQGFTGKYIFEAACGDIASITKLVKKPDVLEGAIFEVTPYSLGGSKVDAFASSYKKEFGSDPAYVADYSYEAVKIYAHSMELAKSATDPSKIRASMSKSMADLNKDSIMGYKAVDDTGETHLTFSLGVLKNGKLEGVGQ